MAFAKIEFYLSNWDFDISYFNLFTEEFSIDFEQSVSLRTVQI